MMSFEENNLPTILINGLKKIGFVKPTEIQKNAIPTLLEGRDLMACAQTGSGKTGAYAIPMLASLLGNVNSQGLILAPTRELAQQISDFLQTIITDSKQIHVVKLIGGEDIRKQFKLLQRKPRIIVATPGRLIDHLKRNTVQVQKVDRLVLDEGDRMIDMGFAPQLEQILRFLPIKRQTSLFTATLDKKVQDLAQKYLSNPVTLVLDESRPVSKIKQSVVKVEMNLKNEKVLDELNARPGSVIIFLKTQHRTDRLKKYLEEYGFKVDLIHGGCTQGQRSRALKAFKNGQTRILCATDLAARGIDVPHVEHVINFDLPMQDEDYVHRVGRTARNGAEGEAISFVTSQEYRDWNRLVKKYDIRGAHIVDPSAKTQNHGRGVKKPSFRSAQGKPKSAGKGNSRHHDHAGKDEKKSGSRTHGFSSRRDASGEISNRGPRTGGRGPSKHWGKSKNSSGRPSASW